MSERRYERAVTLAKKHFAKVYETEDFDRRTVKLWLLAMFDTGNSGTQWMQGYVLRKAAHEVCRTFPRLGRRMHESQTMRRWQRPIVPHGRFVTYETDGNDYELLVDYSREG